MPPNYSTMPLSPKTMERAFALVAGIAPDVTLELWQSFASRREHFVAVTENGDGYLRGLCIYAVANVTDERPVIEAMLFAALAAVNRRAVARTMLEFIKSEARRVGSETIRFRTPSAEDLALLLSGRMRLAEMGDATTMRIS